MLYVIGLSGIAILTLWVYTVACAVRDEWTRHPFNR